MFDRQLHRFVLPVLWNFTVKLSLYNTNQPEKHITVTPSSKLGLKIVAKFIRCPRIDFLDVSMSALIPEVQTAKIKGL